VSRNQAKLEGMLLAAGRKDCGPAMLSVRTVQQQERAAFLSGQQLVLSDNLAW